MKRNRGNRQNLRTVFDHFNKVADARPISKKKKKQEKDVVSIQCCKEEKEEDAN